MADYRLYRLDPHDGQINGAEDFVSDDDVLAICIARSLANGSSIELWCGARNVARIDVELMKLMDEAEKRG
jgi:hypothetical protein